MWGKNRILKEAFGRFQGCVGQIRQSALLNLPVSAQIDKEIHGVLRIRESIRVVDNFRFKNSQDLLSVVKEFLQDVVKCLRF